MKIPLIIYYFVIIFWLLPSFMCVGLTIEPGNERDESMLVYGWSYPEALPNGETMRWIEKIEGELNVQGLVPDKKYQLRIDAMPVCQDKKVQIMGVYCNGNYVAEWLMNTNGCFDVYQIDLSPKIVNADENNLIIRAGFVYSPESDPRELGIAVKKIVITEKQHE